MSRFVTGRAGLAAATAVTLMLLASACSSSGSDSATKATTTTTAPASGSASSGGSTCSDGVSIKNLKAVAVPGEDHEWTVTSFDGTEIRAHWFPFDGATASTPAPTILMGPGWGEAGDTSTTGDALFPALSIPGLHDHGYNVLTWDPRGFGKSTGAATVDSTNEGRDVQALLDFVAQQPEAKLDRAGDPRTGMVGFSYGGGIQFTTAARDCRVDAIVPGIAWHSLGTSLFKNRTVKSGWAGLLLAAAAGANLDPHITSANESGKATGTLSAEDEQWFLDRGPADTIAKVKVPTFIIQGTVDTLFTLDEAVTNLRILQDNGVPVGMLFFCGGHGACLTNPGPKNLVADAEFAWLDRYVNGNDSADVGSVFRTVDQDGKVWADKDYPARASDFLKGTGSGALDLLADGGAGPITGGAKPGDVIGAAVTGITPARAARAVNVGLTATTSAMALGAPKLTVTYSGTPGSGSLPTRVFAQLVDETKGVVIGNQITPIPVTLDGTTHTATFDLEIIAQQLKAGDKLTLQITPTTVAYRQPQLGGKITFTNIQIRVPLVSSLTDAASGGSVA